MRILIRLDAGPKVGMGHLMRSISVAEAIREAEPESEIIFLTHKEEVTLARLEEKQFACFLNEQQLSEEEFIEEAVRELKPSVLFIDKIFPYQEATVKQLKKLTKVVILHNACKGAFVADVFIMPSAHHDEKIRQKAESYPDLCYLEGPEFIILNNQVLKVATETAVVQENQSKPVQVAITTGGSDPRGVMITLLNYLKDFEAEDVEVIALVGSSFFYRQELEELSSTLPDYIKFKAFDLVSLQQADLCISTFGVSTYELIYLGLAVLSVGHAEPNALGSKRLASNYAIVEDLGLIDGLEKEHFLKVFRAYIQEAEKRSALKSKCQGFLDGKGAVRVADIIVKISKDEEVCN